MQLQPEEKQSTTVRELKLTSREEVVVVYWFWGLGLKKTQTKGRSENKDEKNFKSKKCRNQEESQTIDVCG